MAEYVDKKEVYAVACKGCIMAGDEYGTCYCTEPGCERLTLAFVSALAADVVAVVHGRWILHDNGSGTCDQCRFTQKNVWDDDNQQNYCGVCGAKMNGWDAG